MYVCYACWTAVAQSVAGSDPLKRNRVAGEVPLHSTFGVDRRLSLNFTVFAVRCMCDHKDKNKERIALSCCHGLLVFLRKPAKTRLA